MDLPGRPTGNADALRAAAHAWEHLAWELWQLSRALENKADALAQGWSGAAGDAYVDVWRQVRRGFYDLDGRIHDVAGRLRGAADAIEGGQAAYDRTLAAIGISTVVGIGLTVFSLGLSDAAAAEADSAIAATAATIIADLEVTLARMAALFAESAEALGGLASRFAVNFAVRAPELAYGPAGGGGIGVGLALASGVHDPLDVAVSGLVGAAESIGGGKRGRPAETGATEAGSFVTDVLSTLPAGGNPGVWTVSSEGRLLETFDALTKGGTATTWKGYSGRTYEVPDGTQIGLRPTSASGGPTIDIRMPSGDQWKIHIR